MAKARALDKRRKSIRNIRKITRTMELIATARFRKAMDRATAATAYTQKITQLVADLSRTGVEVSHPLLDPHPQTESVALLVLTANRGLCGGYNGNVQRAALARWADWSHQMPEARLEISGKRGISGFRYRKIIPHDAYTHFEDKVRFEEVEVLANRYLDEYLAGKLDRLDVVYTKFESASRQHAVIETLLPLASLETAPVRRRRNRGRVALRVSSLRGEHSGGNRSGQLQDPPVQVFPGCGGERTDRANDRDEVRHRKRRRFDSTALDATTTGHGSRKSPERSWKSSGASKPSTNNQQFRSARPRRGVAPDRIRGGIEPK